MRLHVVGSGSSGNCYLLEEQGEYLALDAGCKMLDVKKACGFNVTSIQAAIITHKHRDHAEFIKDFHGNAIDCYTGWHQAEEIAEKYGQKCKSIPKAMWSNVSANWRVLPFNVPHDDVPNFGYIIEYIPDKTSRVCYITDFEYVPFTFKSFDITTWLLECNYSGEIEKHENEGKYEHVLKGHSSLDTVKGIIQANLNDSMQNVILCHVSSTNADVGMILREITALVPETVNVTIAQKGKAFDL